jgi:Ca-activated chloride channel family protein
MTPSSHRQLEVMAIPFDGRALQFENPAVLGLLLVVGAMVVIDLRRRRRGPPGLLFSSLGLLPQTRPPVASRFAWVAVALRATALGLFVVALAHPQTIEPRAEVISEGIDIVLATDVSGSMDEATFGGTPKIQAVRSVAREFVSRLKNDRVGLVVFAGDAAIIGPLTQDYAASVQLVERFIDTSGTTLTGGTAIGTGLAMAVDVLRDSEAKAKVVILLTDGENNSGDISPLDAANIARLLGIRVYTIGAVGQQALTSDSVDEQVMQKMATLTGGQYFRADDVETLRAIYGDVAQLEKSKVGVREFTGIEEAYLLPLVAGAVLLFLEISLSVTVFRRSP